MLELLKYRARPVTVPPGPVLGPRAASDRLPALLVLHHHRRRSRLPRVHHARARVALRVRARALRRLLRPGQHRSLVPTLVVARVQLGDGRRVSLARGAVRPTFVQEACDGTARWGEWSTPASIGMGG